ncbi:MAG: acyl carrier protein, partial [Methylococcales bacterium]
LLIKNKSNKGVMEFNWTALTRFLPTANSPKFHELTKNSVKDDDKNSSNDIEQLLLTLSDEELLTTFIEMLKIETGEILRMSPHKIDAHKSIYDMGLDSLMGVELMVALEARFGIRLPVMTLNETPTLAKLAERIILLLKTGEQDTFNESDIMAQTQQIFSKHDVENAEELINTTVQNLQAKNYNHSTDKIIH